MTEMLPPRTPAVLVADDEFNLRTLVTAALQGACQTIAAEDGDQAWGMLQSCRPAAAILDIHMPRRSGLDVLRDIRSHPTLRDLPVILLTGDAGSPALSATFDGRTAFLAKPFDGRRLRQMVVTLLAYEGRPAHSGSSGTAGRA